ncbi:hypothetical protein CRM22_000401 [Opisthorchis felineus]|uniref:Uncharacterized protein n=1 Tax=Opisthorchis felineus TaxID=147828 RepID=A0A4S2MFJ7_OPIFE|nr:hypothetical protein CRM22_000401 [Opisthorchis felineus]
MTASADRYYFRGGRLQQTPYSPIAKFSQNFIILAVAWCPALSVENQQLTVEHHRVYFPPIMPELTTQKTNQVENIKSTCLPHVTRSGVFVMVFSIFEMVDCKPRKHQ